MTSTYEAVTNPIDTLNALGYAITHPDEIPGAVWDACTSSPEGAGECLADFLIGKKGAGVASDTARTVRRTPDSTSPLDNLTAPRTPGNDFQVVDPLNPGRTITDIDTFRPGQLVELKSATSAADPQAWIQKHIVRKTESYLEARQHILGWEQADIVFDFTKPGADPAFVRSVNEAVTGLDATTPGVNISVRWAP